jgi:hypothetical protein
MPSENSEAEHGGNNARYRRSPVSMPLRLGRKHASRLLDNDESVFADCLSIVRAKVRELAALQMLPRALTTDVLRQFVKTCFLEDEVTVVVFL